MPMFKVAVESIGLAIDAAGVIVVIPTFPSMALEVELDGRWPWQRENALTSN